MKTPNNQPGDRVRMIRQIVVLVTTIAALVGAAAVPAHSAETSAGDGATSPVDVQSSDPSFAEKVQAMYWRGRTCSTPACKAARPSGVAEVASFGLAAFGGAWFSRRRTG